MDGHCGRIKTMDGEPRSRPYRRRLPNRRPALTQEIVVNGGTALVVTIGLDPEGRPAGVFVNGGKTGSAMDFLLGDLAVIVSVGLQCGVSARAMAKSISRLPESLDGPPTKAASAAGAILDLIAEYERART
jgi:hypothetical protein